MRLLRPCCADMILHTKSGMRHPQNLCAGVALSGMLEDRKALYGWRISDFLSFLILDRAVLCLVSLFSSPGFVWMHALNCSTSCPEGCGQRLLHGAACCCGAACRLQVSRTMPGSTPGLFSDPSRIASKTVCPASAHCQPLNMPQKGMDSSSVAEMPSATTSIAQDSRKVCQKKT